MNIVRNINLSEIKANPYQPRTKFDPEQLADLANSIQKDGLIQPVVLRKVPGGFEIIAGERRCRAAELAGLRQVPALVMNADDSKSARLALIENIQREDLNAIEEAKAFQQLLQMDDITQEELAKRLGKSQSTIANKMRLLNLSEEVQDGLMDGKLTERQARALLTVDQDQQVSLYHKIAEMNLDSAGTEKFLKDLGVTKTKRKAPTRETNPQNKLFIRDARIAVNTIESALKTIKQSNLKITSETVEEEDAYTVTIHIEKV